MGAKISKSGDKKAAADNDCDKVVKGEAAPAFRGRRGNSLDRSFRTLPRHLERGRNLSKRFRKSCRNWAASASKGFANNSKNSSKDVKVEGQHNIDNTAVHEKEDNDIVVIDLEEDPELKYKSSPDTDIGQLVACLVLDAKRNNTLPRSRSRITVSSEAETASLNQSPAAISVADQDDKVEDSVPREEVS